MSWLTILWSICVASSGMLAAIHLFLWFYDRKKNFYVWSSLACFGAAVTAVGELGIMKASSFEEVDRVIFWQIPAIGLLIVSLTWFLFTWFGTGRRWLALAITSLWGVAVAHCVLLPGNPLFAEILALEPHETFWGEAYVSPTGPLNPLKWLGDIASILFLLFVIDTSVRLFRDGNQRRACAVGGVITLFIVLAGIHTPLVDSALVKTPYLIGFFFLGIVISLTFELIRDLARASQTADELGQVRAQLEHLGRVNLLGELSAAIAHELNQPLTAILANAQAGVRFLKVPQPDLSEINEILVDVANDSKRARSVIQRLRTLLEKRKLIRESIDLNDTIREAVTMMGHELETQGVDLQVDLADDLPPVLADRLGVQQVVINLLINAERATLSNSVEAPWIGLRSRLDGNTVSIEVTDNGIGIDADSLSRIFDPFFTTAKDGLGMGLSICRTIADAHGGSIAVENRSGGGAAFTVNLKLAEPEVSA